MSTPPRGLSTDRSCWYVSQDGTLSVDALFQKNFGGVLSEYSWGFAESELVRSAAFPRRAHPCSTAA
jgi:hypothetical protein